MKRRMKGCVPLLVVGAFALMLIVLGSAMTAPSARAGEDSVGGATSVHRPAHSRGHGQAHGSAIPSPDGAVRLEDDLVKFGGNTIIERNQCVETVVVLGGDLVVRGTVLDEIVVFGGDVRVESTGVVGSPLKSDETSIMVFGGKVTSEPGSQIFGASEMVRGSGLLSRLIGGQHYRESVLDPSPIDFSFFGWVVQTVFSLVLALIAVALMPRHIAAVQRKLEEKPLPSAGWGALGLLVVVPVVTIALVVSIIGLLVVLPWALFVALACFFTSVSVAAFVAQRLLSAANKRESLIVATVLGVVGTTIVSRIPVVGSLILFVMMVFGVGAGALAVAEWGRARRARKAVAAGPNDSAGSGGPGGSEAPGGSGDAPVVVDVPVEVQSAPVEQQAEAPSEVPQPEQLEQSDEAPVAEQQTEASVEPVAEQQAEAPQLEQPSESSSSEQPAEGAESPQSARLDEV